MKSFVAAVVLLCLSISPAARADTPDDQYINIYGLIEQGDTLNGKGNADEARAKYAEALKQLKKLQTENPLWNTQTVKFRINYLNGKLAGSAPGGSSSTSAADTTPPPGINLADPVEMKIKWQAGKKYKEQVSVSMIMDLNVPGAPKPMKQETTMTQGAAISVVKETDGGGHELMVEMQSMQMLSKMGGQVLMSFDSKKDAKNDSANPMAKMIGMKVKVLVDGAGKVESIEGSKGAAKEVDDDPVTGKSKLIDGVLSESSIKDLVDDGKELPPNPVKVGDTWTVTHETEAGQLGMVVFNMNLKFKGWAQHDGHKCAVFDVSGTMTPKGDATAIKIEDSKFAGTTWFDPVMGLLVDSDGHITSNVSVEAQGQKIAAKMNLTVGKKLLEVKDAK